MLTHAQTESLHTRTHAHIFLAGCPAVPAGGAEGRDPGLEDSRVESERAFSGDAEEDGGKDQPAVDHQADHHRHHVHAQLPGDHLQVSDRRDLPGDQGGDADRRIPEERSRIRAVSLLLLLFSPCLRLEGVSIISLSLINV